MLHILGPSQKSLVGAGGSTSMRWACWDSLCCCFFFLDPTCEKFSLNIRCYYYLKSRESKSSHCAHGIEVLLFFTHYQFWNLLVLQSEFITLILVFKQQRSNIGISPTRKFWPLPYRRISNDWNSSRIQDCIGGCMQCTAITACTASNTHEPVAPNIDTYSWLFIGWLETHLLR